MSTHPYAARRDFAQQRVEIGAVVPLVNRVHPDDHAADRSELRTHGMKNIVFIDERFRINSEIGER